MVRYADAAQPASRDTFVVVAQDVSWFLALTVCLGVGEFLEWSYCIAVPTGVASAPPGVNRALSGIASRSRGPRASSRNPVSPYTSWSGSRTLARGQLTGGAD